MKSIKTKIGHLKMKRSKNSKNFIIKKLQKIKEDNVIYECSSLNTIFPNSEINYPVDFDNDHLFYYYINNYISLHYDFIFHHFKECKLLFLLIKAVLEKQQRNTAETNRIILTMIIGVIESWRDKNELCMFLEYYNKILNLNVKLPKHTNFK